MKEVLTVSIPTYNRHEKLLSTLNALNKTKGEYPFEVLIIDNGSTPNVETFLEDSKLNFKNKITIKRNEANIGIGANILFAHIQPQTEWTWLLGDDDMPMENCFVLIFNDIKNIDKDAFLLKYNSKAGGWPTNDRYIKSEYEFFEFCKNFKYYSNILFISNSVFKTKSMQLFAHDMMNISQTMCPWILGYLKNIKSGKTIHIFKEYIVEHGLAEKENSWNYHKLREGMLSYSDIINENDFKVKMYRPLFYQYFPKSKGFVMTFFLYPFHYKQFDYKYWKWFYIRSSMVFTGYRSAILITLSKLIRFYYNSKLINKVISLKIRSNKIEDNGRN